MAFGEVCRSEIVARTWPAMCGRSCRAAMPSSTTLIIDAMDPEDELVDAKIGVRVLCTKKGAFSRYIWRVEGPCELLLVQR